MTSFRAKSVSYTHLDVYKRQAYNGLRIADSLESGAYAEDPNGIVHYMGVYESEGTYDRSNWSAVARGHARYLWAAEHYLGAKLYGRYLAHGSLQILRCV